MCRTVNVEYIQLQLNWLPEILKVDVLLVTSSAFVGYLPLSETVAQFTVYDSETSLKLIFNAN